MISIARFAELLGQTPLLTAAQLREFDTSVRPRFTELRPLARELMERHWLTPYQINELARGHAGHLVLGPYLLLERLGKGGMGQVFKARHRKMNRVVALKVIRQELLANSRALRRFHREIQLAAQLDHPNVVHAFDADVVGGRHFLVMEYVEGTNLSLLVRGSGPVPVPRACDFGRQAALGLQHGHERGLVHRDVKPSNLLLKTCGSVVKVVDWGLARLQDGPGEGGGHALTLVGTALGTAGFIAPEQLLDSRQADARADLYGLGSTLYFLLTARSPFPQRSKLAGVLSCLGDEPERLEDLCPAVPPGLAAVVRRLMARRPEDRYQSAAEVAAALAPFLGQGVGLMAPNCPSPLSR
jgi:serine/threonine protein kinase